MELNQHLYYGLKANEKSAKIKKALKTKKWFPGLYLIAISTHPDHVLDVFEAVHFLQPGFKDDQYHILGVAIGRAEAYELVRNLVDEVYQNTGACDLKKYFQQT